MMKDPLYDSDNSDIIVLYPVVVDKYYTGEIKRNLKYNKQIIKLIIKAIKITKISAAYIIICIL